MDLDALFRAAGDHYRAARIADAEAGYRGVLARRPDHGDALHLLGLLLVQSGRTAEALPLLARSATLLPARPDVHANRGEALRQAGRLPAAELCFRRALELAPAFPEAHFNLGNVLKAQGRHSDAIASYEEAVRLRPHYARAWYNLGNALREEGRAAPAVDAYRRALALQPAWGDAHLNLANAFYDLRDLDAAAEHYQHAARAKPDDPSLSDSLGNAYLAAGRVGDAVVCFREALARCPVDWLRELRVAAVAPIIPGSNDAIDEYRARLAATLDRLIDRRPTAGLTTLHSSAAEPPLLLAYQGRDDRPLKERYATLFGAALPPADPLPRRTGGLPRIGVVVTRGHEGVFARCLGDLIARLDRTKLSAQIVCPRSSANVLRHLLPHAGPNYFLIPERLDEAAAKLRAAAFDLLFYWEVGTDSTNYFLPYFRAARLQAATWGWPVTTGVPGVDYYVSAADLEPPDADPHYTERLVRLPSLPTYYLRPPVPATPADRGRYGLRPGEHLYLCQQNLRKVHPDFDPILADILRADPTGRVVLIADEQPRVTEMLLDRLRTTIPDVVGRVVVANRVGRADYLALVKAADVVLDTVHYGGGANTAYDAAACGTPTVTLPGPFHRGRWAAAVNRRLDVPELNVATSGGYARTAVQVASEADVRTDLVARIAAAAGQLFEDSRAITDFHDFVFTAVF